MVSFLNHVVFLVFLSISLMCFCGSIFRTFGARSPGRLAVSHGRLRTFLVTLVGTSLGCQMFRETGPKETLILTNNLG